VYASGTESHISIIRARMLVILPSAALPYSMSHAPCPHNSFSFPLFTCAPMEPLSLHDPAVGSAPPSQHAAPPPQLPMMGVGVPQLPPQMFTTAAQLLDLTDKKLVIALRDGRKLIGVLRSWDQFGNLVLQDTVERIFAREWYADVPRGLFLVRGENVSILGEIVCERGCFIPPLLAQS